jgi:hypothetical protein
LNWLYSALIVKQPIDPSYLMINWWCCEATSGSRDIGSWIFRKVFRGKKAFLKVPCRLFNFADSLTTCETNRRIGGSIAGFFLFQDDWNLVNSRSHELANFGHLESGKFRKSWTCELQTSGIWWIQEVMNRRTSGSLRNHSSGVLINDDLREKRFRKLMEGQVKDVISKSLGLKCELMAGL